MHAMAVSAGPGVASAYVESSRSVPSGQPEVPLWRTPLTKVQVAELSGQCVCSMSQLVLPGTHIGERRESPGRGVTSPSADGLSLSRDYSTASELSKLEHRVPSPPQQGQQKRAGGHSGAWASMRAAGMVGGKVRAARRVLAQPGVSQ